MREALIDILACPVCQAPLRFAPGATMERSGDRIQEAVLACSGCGAHFPVSGGVPRLLPGLRLDAGSGSYDQRRTASHFTAEFTLLAEGDRDMDPPEVLRFLFYSRTGIDPALFRSWSADPYDVSRMSGPSSYQPDPRFLHGKRVLDAGCGPGRFTRVAAEAAEHVVGLDLGDHVDRAASRCRDQENVDLVQGSVLAPPFLPDSFDFVFSVGVLHHTPDPKQGCVRLAKLVRPEGAMSVWVYPPEYWGGPLREPIGRAVHGWLSRLSPERSLDVCARWLYPIGRLQMRLAEHRWTKILAAPLFLLSVPRHPKREVMIATIHDYYGPTIISTHDDAEVESWLREAGFVDRQRLPVSTGWFAQNRTLAVAMEEVE